MIRPFVASDYTNLANLKNTVDPEWPVTAELLEQWDKLHSPEHHYARFVLEQDNTLVACGETGHDSHAFEEGKFWLYIQVHPDHRNNGLGKQLYQHLLAHLEQMRAKLLQVFIQEDKKQGVSWLGREGYTVMWKRYPSKVQTKGFDFSPYEGLEHNLKSSGIEIKSLAELTHPRANQQLWELDWLLMQDVPMGVTLTKRSFEQWMKEEVDDPQFLKEACMIALDPQRDDPLTGNFVGYTSLMRGIGHYGIGMTGVLKDYRGKGIAKALKLATMRYVQAHGGGEIRTINDPPNAAMLGMNISLGFKRQPSYLRFQKALDGRRLEPFTEEKVLSKV
jgi:mycothiol synthase